MTADSLIPAGLAVVTRYLDLAGVFSCAMLGGAVARTAGLDLFGFLVVGIISGLGGGMIRDVLLQHGTPVALTDYAYVTTAVAGSVVVFLIKISEESWNRLFTALDAAVIGFWAVTGATRPSRSAWAGCPPSCWARSPRSAAAPCATSSSEGSPRCSAGTACTPPSPSRSPGSR